MDKFWQNSKPHARTEPQNGLVVVECPFCDALVSCSPWSLAGSGKMCECGAKHVWTPAISYAPIPEWHRGYRCHWLQVDQYNHAYVDLQPEGRKGVVSWKIWDERGECKTVRQAKAQIERLLRRGKTWQTD